MYVEMRRDTTGLYFLMVRVACTTWKTVVGKTIRTRLNKNWRWSIQCHARLNSGMSCVEFRNGTHLRLTYLRLSAIPWRTRVLLLYKCGKCAVFWIQKARSRCTRYLQLLLDTETLIGMYGMSTDKGAYHRVYTV